MAITSHEYKKGFQKKSIIAIAAGVFLCST
jgi:hypothetical protein